MTSSEPSLSLFVLSVSVVTIAFFIRLLMTTGDEGGLDLNLDYRDNPGVNLESEGYNVVGSIPVHQFPSRGSPLDVVTAIAAARLPVVLRGAPTDYWNALRWTPESLASKYPIMHNVFSSNLSGVLYSDKRPLSNIISPQKSRVFSNLPTKEFFNLSSNDSVCRTFFGQLKDKKLKPLSGDLEPRGFLQPADKFNNASTASEQLNIWITSPGCKTLAHFDPTQNFFQQISGRKRFVVAPPTAFSKKTVHPFLHPSARHSVLERASCSLEPVRIPRLDVWLADLEPGDLLYLPPFWMHEVSPLGAQISVSANVFPNTQEMNADQTVTIWADEMVMRLINYAFEERQPAHLLLPCFVLEFLSQVIRAVGKLIGHVGAGATDTDEDAHALARAFVQQYLWRRYEHTFGEGWCPQVSDLPQGCMRQLPLDQCARPTCFDRSSDAQRFARELASPPGAETVLDIYRNLSALGNTWIWRWRHANSNATVTDFPGSSKTDSDFTEKWLGGDGTVAIMLADFVEKTLGFFLSSESPADFCLLLFCAFR